MTFIFLGIDEIVPRILIQLVHYLQKNFRSLVFGDFFSHFGEISDSLLKHVTVNLRLQNMNKTEVKSVK